MTPFSQVTDEKHACKTGYHDHDNEYLSVLEKTSIEDLEEWIAGQFQVVIVSWWLRKQ
jgi:hypothetical protein